METSPAALSVFIRENQATILERWDRAAVRLVGKQRHRGPLLRNNIRAVLDKIRNQLEDPERCHALQIADVASMAVPDHVMQRVETGVSIEAVTAELMALRSAIEELWPAKDLPAAGGALLALRDAMDDVILASIHHFTDLRMTLLSMTDDVIRSYPGKSFDDTLRAILRLLFNSIKGIDTASILLLEEGNILRVRAAVGLEGNLGFKAPVGAGFAGLIAAERKSRLVQGRDAIDSLVLNPAIKRVQLQALYGVPLIRGDDILGVAHMGSKSACDFSEEAKVLFRMIMDRITGILGQELLRERAELQESQHKAILESSPTIIYLKDLEGRYVSVNRRAVLDLGMPPDQFIGRTAYEIFPKEIADALSETDREVVEHGTTLQQDEVFLRQGREQRIYLSTKFPTRDSRGQISGIAGVSTDVTERRRWQQGQALLVDISGMLASSLEYEQILPRVARRLLPTLADCCMIDMVQGDNIRRIAVEHRDLDKAELARRLLTIPLDRSRLHISDAVLKSQEPVIMTNVPPDYLDTISQSEEHRQLLHELDPRSMIQIPLRARGRLLGSWLFMRCGSSEVYDKTDVELAIDFGWRVSLAIDNSNLYQAERIASNAREEILGVVAHDLRNPLGNIALAGLRLRQELSPETDPQHRKVIEVISNSAARMDKLIRDLLDQHAIEKGQLSIEVRNCSPSELVHDAVEAAMNRFESASLSLTTDVQGQLPAVLADKDRILQVFSNLLDNAAKVTPSGGCVTVGAKRVNNEIQFFVRDSGPGIPPPVLPHIFDRYWRLQRRDRRGLGLGLSICKGIIDAHGGRIWAINETQIGASVFFTLPETVS